MKLSPKGLGAFHWSDKLVLNKGWLAGAGVLLSSLYLGMRILPYVSRQEESKAYVGRRTLSDSAQDREHEKMRDSLNQHKLSAKPSSEGKKGGSDFWGMFQSRPIQGYSGTSNPPKSSSHLVERPFLDGASMLLQASLIRSWASNEGDASVEARVLGAISSQIPSDPDNLQVQGGTLLGQAQGNSETHRLEVRFTELRLPDGKRHPITGIALSLDGQTYGIPAHFSSGAAPRMLGAVIGEVINTADTVATARILQNTSEETVALRETHQLLSRTTGRAGSELGETASRDLKATRAVLSVDAGTPFIVKLQGTSVNGGGS